MTVHVQNENVADMQALSQTNYAITGVANADLQATGTLHNLQGSGKLQIAKLTIYGEPFKTFSSDLRLSGTEARLENIQLAHNGARIYRILAYDLESKITGMTLPAPTLTSPTFSDLICRGSQFRGRPVFI